MLAPMSKWDEVDPQRARQYAWRLGVSDEVTELAVGAATSPGTDAATGDLGVPDGPPSEEARQSLAAMRAEAAESCTRLAAAVDRVWRLEEDQARFVGPLAETASELGPMLVAMRRHAIQGVRLLRLVNRHWQTLPEESRSAIFGAVTWICLDHREAADLLVEIARDENVPLAQGMSFALSVLGRSSEETRGLRESRLEQQLIDLLAASPADAWVRQQIALDWLAVSCTRAAVPTLRKLLRAPHLGVRLRTLQLYLTSFQPTALTPEDVLFLIKNLLAHPPLRRGVASFEEDSYYYARAVARAIALVRPPGGAEPLVEIVRGANSLLVLGTHCDSGWALGALAGGYPDVALPFIDDALRTGLTARRYSGVEAAAQLPEELARPRLLAAAADGAPLVSERARALWLDRFSVPCPLEPLAGLPVELLQDEPSDRLRGRLLVLRSASDEVRQAMVEALLQEAGDPEALALLTFALCDSSLLRTRYRSRLPQKIGALFGKLYQRFGGPAIRALCILAERYPLGFGVDYFQDLSDLFAGGKVRKRDAGPARALAVQRLDAPRYYTQKAALQLLAKTGAPPELRERLLTLACGSTSAASYAADVLAAWPRRDRVLDGRIAAEAQRMLAARDAHGLYSLLHLGFRRKLPAIAELAAGILEAWIAQQAVVAARRMQPVPAAADGKPEPEPIAPFIAVLCARLLREGGLLPASWLRDALAAPASPRFDVAAALASRAPGPLELAALRPACDSTERGGDAARAAVSARISAGDLEPNAPRVRELLLSAPDLPETARLMHLTLRAGIREEALPVLAQLLELASEAPREALADIITRRARCYEPAELAALIAETQHPLLLAALEAAVERPSYDDDSYWQDREPAEPL